MVKVWNPTAYGDKQSSVTGGRAAELQRHACQLNYSFHSNITPMCALRLYVCHCIIGPSISHHYPAPRYSALFWLKATVKMARCSKERWCNQKWTLRNLVCVAWWWFCFLSVTVWHRSTFCCKCTMQDEMHRIFNHIFFSSLVLSLHLHAAYVRYCGYSNWSGCAWKR